MAEATIKPARTSTSDLRIVLFGLKSAGKSSLLGALAQAAQTQEKYLKGTLTDRSEGRLASLHQRLFEDAPEQTEDDIVLYPLTFQPLTAAGPGPVRDVMIFDCNGQSASDVLMNQQFDGVGRRNALVRALADADTVVLVVDGSDKPSQLERDFAQFANFLRLFEESRARHGDVGGLPVYLVLTKCDLLAQPSDTAGTWIQRIEERKRQVAQRFQKFLAKQADPSFGRINLNLWATAIHRPALADRPAKSVEPFGVADLFRQCLQSAMAYDAIRKDSSRRLQFTLFGVAALVLVMATLALAFYLGRPPEGMTRVAHEIEMIMPASNAKVEERIDARDAVTKAARLKELMQDPSFVALPKDTKNQVSQYVQEIEEYEALKAKYKDVRTNVNFLERADELKSAQDRLTAFVIPEKFAAAYYGQTKKQLETDLKAMSDGVVKQVDWYQKQLAEGKPLFNVNLGELLAYPEKGQQWLAKVDEFRFREPPFPNNDKIAAGAASLKNRTIYDFETVKRAREELDTFKTGLLKLRNVVAK